MATVDTSRNFRLSNNLNEKKRRKTNKPKLSENIGNKLTSKNWQNQEAVVIDSIGQVLDNSDDEDEYDDQLMMIEEQSLSNDSEDIY